MLEAAARLPRAALGVSRAPPRRGGSGRAAGERVPFTPTGSDSYRRKTHLLRFTLSLESHSGGFKPSSVTGPCSHPSSCSLAAGPREFSARTSSRKGPVLS